MRSRLLALSVAVAVAGGGSGAHADPFESVQKGQLIFRTHCALCHDDSEHMLNDNGPALFGVVGRRVGSVPNFEYSQVLQDANRRGDRWTESRLDQLLRKPTGVYDGTAMPMNFSKVADRRAIVAYLKTLKPR